MSIDTGGAAEIWDVIHPPFTHRCTHSLPVCLLSTCSASSHCQPRAGVAFLAPFPMALLVGRSTYEDRGPRPGFLQLTVGPRAVGLGRGSLVLRRWVGAVFRTTPLARNPSLARQAQTHSRGGGLLELAGGEPGAPGPPAGSAAESSHCHQRAPGTHHLPQRPGQGLGPQSLHRSGKRTCASQPRQLWCPPSALFPPPATSLTLCPAQALSTSCIFT